MYTRQTKPKFYKPQRKLINRDTAGKRAVLVCPYTKISGFIQARIFELMSPVNFSLLSDAQISNGRAIEDQVNYVKALERNMQEPFLIIDFQKTRNIVDKIEYPKPVIDIVDFLGYQVWADSRKHVLYYALKEIYAECLKEYHEYDYRNNINPGSVPLSALSDDLLHEDLEKMVNGENNLNLFTPTP